MNPISTDPTAPPPPPQPPRSSFSCDRHPDEQFTGFCPSCLCERLTTLDQSSTNTPSSSRRPSSASAAIKSFFTSTSKATNSFPPPPPLPKTTKQASFFSELRRTKSFSASKNEALGLSCEPQRKSCDVRARSTLSTLFTLENENKSGASVYRPSSIPPSVPTSSRQHQHQQNSQRIESCAVSKIVSEKKDKDEGFGANAEKDEIVCDDYSGSNGDEIRPVRDSHLESLRNLEETVVNSGEIVEEQVSVVNLKPMKEHIDVDAQEKKSTGGGFWAKASVFSNKWHKWRRKQKRKKENNGGEYATLQAEKPISGQYEGTQSEVADYGFGRRSWDTGPRFSLDAARISFDDTRYSLDESRASWDGHSAGRSFPRMAPMVSVMEDAPAVQVPRPDMQIPVEEPTANSVNEVDDGVPGGSAQTKEYYSDPSLRKRKSLDRSSSIRKTAAAAVVEVDEVKTSSNAKVSPAVGDNSHGRSMVGERDLRDSNSHSLRDDGSETFEQGSRIRDSSNSLTGNGEKKEPKKSKKWSLRLWGFIQRLNGVSKYEEDEKHSRVNGVSRSYSASWQHSSGEGNGDGRNSLNKNMFRSNSSVSWRNANHLGGGSLRDMRKQGGDSNEHGKKGKGGELVLERNRSARYSPNRVDSGLLRLYLAPLRSSRRGGFGKIKSSSSQPIAKSALKLY